MSWKATYATKAPTSPAGKVSNFGGDRLHPHIEKRDNSSKQDQSNKRQKSIKLGPLKAADCDGLDGTATNSGDTNESDGDSANEDDESSSLEDPDAIAPSGRSTDEDGHQAGPIDCTKDTTTLFNDSERCVQHDTQQDSSDDDIYEGIDLISDSEKDGSDMDHLEERAIVDSEDVDEPLNGASDTVNQLPKPGVLSAGPSDDIWEGLDIDQNHLDEPSDYFHEQFSQMDEQNFFNDHDGDYFPAFDSCFDSVTRDPSDVPTQTSQRRVRFAEPPHSEIGGSTLYDESFGMFSNPNAAPPPSPVSGTDQDLGADSDSSSGYECESDAT